LLFQADVYYCQLSIWFINYTSIWCLSNLIHQLHKHMMLIKLTSYYSHVGPFFVWILSFSHMIAIYEWQEDDSLKGANHFHVFYGRQTFACSERQVSIFFIKWKRCFTRGKTNAYFLFAKLEVTYLISFLIFWILHKRFTSKHYMIIK